MNIFTAISEDPKIKEISRCAKYRKGSVESIVSAYEVSFADFWKNKIVTPQDHCDYFGVNASEFFVINSRILEFIQLLIPDYSGPIIPYLFDINENGTVTIKEKINNGDEDEMPPT